MPAREHSYVPDSQIPSASNPPVRSAVHTIQREKKIRLELSAPQGAYSSWVDSYFVATDGWSGQLGAGFG